MAALGADLGFLPARLEEPVKMEPLKLPVPPGFGRDHIAAAPDIATQAANAVRRRPMPCGADASAHSLTGKAMARAAVEAVLAGEDGESDDDASPTVDPLAAATQEREALAWENHVLKERVAYAEENASLAYENARLAEQNAMLRAQTEYLWWQPPTTDPWTITPMPSDPSAVWWQMQLAQQHQQQRHQQLAQMQQPFSAVSPSQRRLARAGGSVKSNSVRCKASTTSFGSSLSLPSTSGSFATSSEDSDDKEEQSKAVQMTTVMMRHIPNNYSRKQLLDLIDDQGFATTYDLAYLPVDFKTEVGLGYAFINFTTPEDAERFRLRFHGFANWSVHSSKVCEVSWSDVLQGVNDNVERYRNSPVMHESVPDEFKPVLFRNGQRIPFPPPTKRIRAPLMNHSLRPHSVVTA